MKYLKNIVFFILIILLINLITSCSSIYYLKYSYKNICLDCQLQIDSLIIIDISNEVNNNNQLNLIITNKSEKSIFLDRDMSTFSINDKLILQPSFLENSLLNKSYSNSFSISEKIGGDFYDPFFKLFYNKSLSEGQIVSSTVNYFIKPYLVIPPKTSCKIVLYDYFVEKIYYLKDFYKKTNYYYSYKEYANFIYDNLKDKLKDEMKYFVFYKFLDEEKWRIRK